MRPQRRHVSLTFQPASNRVLYQPIGVVGIISPWNYPASLALMPLATALAAGNRVMLKPSEITSRTSELLRTMLGGAFGPEQVAVVTGESTVGAAFAALPFDHLLFTGSTPVGRAVMRSASERLVPVTLELGGKSPAIVQPGSSLELAARRIAFGKLANGGQTCVAPDYVLVAEAEVEAFVAEYGRQVVALYPDIEQNPDYSTIVSDHHWHRLHGLIEDARANGARIVELATPPAGRATRHPRTFLPVVILGATPAMRIMHEEIFGPVLPVVAYQSMEAAVAHVNSHPRPLALYFFGPQGPDRRLVLERTVSGGVTINDTLLHYGQDDLPFGGIGASGMGAYHGPEGFKAMSHARAVFEQARFNLTDVIRPPYGRLIERVIRLLLR
jgi:coniferyl-aldehyde dehydrogenase